MIKSIRLINFKNFVDETLRVGPFTVIVGANASGKSNVRDAFRFLHGIGRQYTLAEIIGGKYGPGGQREWEPIRGAPNEIARFKPSDFSSHLNPDSYAFDPVLDSSFCLNVEMELTEIKTYYSIKVGFNSLNPDGFQLLEEELRTDNGIVFKTEEERELGLSLYSEENGEPFGLFTKLSRSQPALTQLGYGDGLRDDDFELVDGVIFLLSRIYFMELSPERMREPSLPGATKLGDSGENLPTVIQEICEYPSRKRILTDWLRELTPMDVVDFVFPHDPSGRIHLMLRESNGTRVSAHSASDGTLRFLALLTAILDQKTRGIYFFEDIDTGIHPTRQALILELIEKQVEKNKIQVMTTTHAPGLLTVMNDVTFENASVVGRLENTNDGIIRPVSRLPNARALRKSQGLDRLLTGGWMEDALAFSEVNYADDSEEKAE